MTTSRPGMRAALSLTLTAVLTAALAFTATTTASAAPGDTYSVTGLVVDGTSAPLEGVTASIRIPDPGYSDTLLSDTTDGTGMFVIPGVPDGTWTISFDLEGYGWVETSVVVAGADAVATAATMLPYTDISGASATISGTGELGTDLTVTTAGWPLGTVFTYQWFAPQSDHSGDLPGETAATYTVKADVIGRDVRVWVYGSVPGVSAPTLLDSENGVLAHAPQQPATPAPADLDAFLATNGSTPVDPTTVGLPASLNPGVAHDATVDWTGADSFVDVYVFSSPVFVGTFPVVNGVVRFTLSPSVLGQLATGNHTLLMMGQTSGTVQSARLSIGLAATGDEFPALPIGGAALLVLLGAGVLVARRRLATTA